MIIFVALNKLINKIIMKETTATNQIKNIIVSHSICPVCNYNKLIQQTVGDIILEGCPNCGFGYSEPVNLVKSTNDNETWLLGEKAWLIRNLKRWFIEVDNQDYGKIVKLNNTALRKKIYDYIEKTYPDDKLIGLTPSKTIFQYRKEDVKEWLSTKPKIFKTKLKIK